MIMRLCGFAFLLAGFSAVKAATEPSLPISAARIDLLDQRGYFTPRCKQALVDLVEAQEALLKSRSESARTAAYLPSLQTEERQTSAQVEDLKKELALYQHPEDDDFAALQSAAQDQASSLEKKLDLAQAFIWSYPQDPRQAEAVQDLQRWQKELADRQQAASASIAKQTAIRQQLLRRVKAHDLSLGEWQTFLGDMSQEELLANLGPPQTRQADSWIYSGNWTWDASTGLRAGLLVHFNGTRVSGVSALAP